MLEHHPLIKEFPDYIELIHTLKQNNNHFVKLFNQYDELDKKVFRAEANQEVITDIELTNWKKQRRRIKDKLYNILLEQKKETLI